MEVAPDGGKSVDDELASPSIESLRYPIPQEGVSNFCGCRT